MYLNEQQLITIVRTSNPVFYAAAACPRKSSRSIRSLKTPSNSSVCWRFSRGRGLLLPSRGRSRGALAGGGRGRGGLGAGEGPPSSDSSDASSGSDHEREANSNAGQLSRDGVDGPEETAYSAGGGAGSSGGRTEKKRGREEEEADEDKYDRWGNKRWKRKPASNVDWLLKCRTKLCELKERTMRKAVSDVFIKNRVHTLKLLCISGESDASRVKTGELTRWFGASHHGKERRLGLLLG